ncbi:MAG: hypothetical protein EZS28_051586, partial [Streblomastix strix]
MNYITEEDIHHVLDRLAKIQDDFLDTDEKWDDNSIFMIEKAVSDIISYLLMSNEYSKKNCTGLYIVAQGRLFSKLCSDVENQSEMSICTGCTPCTGSIVKLLKMEDSFSKWTLICLNISFIICLAYLLYRNVLDNGTNDSVI